MKRERKNQIESIGTDEHASIEQCFIAGIEGSVEAKQALDQQRLCHRAGIPYLGLGALRNLLAKRSSSDLCIHYGSGNGPFLQSKVTLSGESAQLADGVTRNAAIEVVTQGYAC